MFVRERKVCTILFLQRVSADLSFERFGHIQSVVMKESSGPPRRLLVMAVVVSTLTYFPVGYHHSVLNVAHEVFENFINESITSHYDAVPSATTRSTVWSLSVSAWQVGAALASFNAFWVVEKYGRKMTLLVFASLIQLAGSIMMAVSVPVNAIELLIIGRLFCGISAGLVCPTLRIFMSECSPDSHRGTLNSIAGFIMFIAALTAMALGLPECFGTHDLSPLLCGFCAIFSIATICIYPIFPATPTYLYLSRRQSKAAAESFLYYHGSNINVRDMMDELKREKSLSSDKMSFTEALGTRAVQIPLLLSAAAGLSFSSTGMDIFDAYSTEMFEYLGLSSHYSQLASALFNIPGLLGAILAMVFVARVSRRKLLIITLAGCFFLTVLLVITGVIPVDQVPDGSLGIAAAVFVGILTFFYSLGPNAVLESLFAEIAPHKIRSVAGTVSEVAFWLSDTLFVFLFPLALRSIGYYSFLMFAIPLGLCVVYFYFYLPNCNGKSVYEIAQNITLGKTESSAKFLKDEVENVY